MLNTLFYSATASFYYEKRVNIHHRVANLHL